MKKGESIKRFFGNLSKRTEKISLRTLFFICVVFVISFWSFLLVEIHFNGYEQSYGGDFYYHSDDAGQSNMIRDWQAGYREGARVGDDNWFIKFPLYAVTSNLPITPAKQLFVNSWVVLFVTALLIVYAFYRFAPLLTKDKLKQRVALILAALSLAIIPAQAFGTIKMSNSRNIEIGIFLLLLVAFYAYLNRDKWFARRTKLKVGALVLLGGILCADDPLFVYMALAPFMSVSALFYFFGKLDFRQFASLFGFGLAAYASSLVMKLLLVTLLPLHFFEHKSHIATFPNFMQSMEVFFDKGIGMLGIDIFGNQVAKLSTLIAVVMLALVVIAFGAIIYALKVKKSLFYAYITLLIIWVPLLVAISTFRIADEVNRYVILLPFLVPVGVMVTVSLSTFKRQIVVLASILVLLFGLVAATKTFALIRSDTQPNAENYAAISRLESLGLKKGFGVYRLAGINNYLSNQRLAIFPVVCYKGKPMIRNIFYDVGKLKMPSQKTFYLYSPGVSKKPLCPLATITKLFGEPAKIVPLIEGQRTEILIYNYDITSKIPVKR